MKHIFSKPYKTTEDNINKLASEIKIVNGFSVTIGKEI